MSKITKMSAVASAVSAILLSGVATAASYQDYNVEKKQSIKQQYAELNNTQTKAAEQETLTWLVKLKTPSIAEQNLAGVAAKTARVDIAQAQQSVETAIQDLNIDLQVVSKTSKLVNALVVNGTQKDVEQLLNNRQVEKILPVYDYKLNVAESADYIKATSLIQAGKATGAGIRVAVLDTGVDYTHKAIGGSGNVADYQAAAADPADTPAWPQGKVIGGYDFINNDPDPIDVNTNHGTHVSHSVLGISPDVELFVYSVCNSGCPGLAQLNALEAAMDPNGDGDISDRVDVINMSLGGDFGRLKGGAVQELIDKAVKLGTNVVISAGNDGPVPFIVGGPSTSANALSVGAMTHPTIESAHTTSSFLGADVAVGISSFNPEDEFEFNSDTAPIVFYPTGTNTAGEETSLACEDFPTSVDFTGKAVLVDRNTCNFTQKVLKAQARGAAFVIIANRDEGSGPISPGGSAHPDITINSIGVSYGLGKAIKAELKAGNNVAYSVKAELKSQVGAIASFTSRGPSMDGLLKPEITAPGVSIMTAHPGLGEGLTPASGTSFSGPITAGAMSMLHEALPTRNALELKATIMNSANLDVTMEPRAINPNAALAPISYIGAGLVDLDKATSLPVAAWAQDTQQAALSFGLVSLSKISSLTKTVVVKNFSNDTKTYRLSHDQRFADDAERGALSMNYPESITVGAGQTMTFDVVVTIDPSKLPEWTLDSSNLQDAATSSLLTTVELDGALYFSENNEKAFHLVYHVLPKATASAEVAPMKSADGIQHQLTNTGAAQLDPFFAPTVATDVVGDAERLDIIGASIETLPVPAQFCESGYMTFTTMVLDKPLTLTYQGGFLADVDFPAKGETKPDGVYDYTIQSGQLSWFGDQYPTGQAITFTHPYNKSSGEINDIYFTAGNNYLTLSSCVEKLGLDGAALAAGVPASIRFRTEERSWTPVPKASLDEVIVDYTFKVSSGEVAALVDTAGNELEDGLAPGETANLVFGDSDFIMLADNGAMAMIAKPTADAQVAPVITADQAFSVQENTANGTVIGEVAVTYASTLAKPVSEFIVTRSSSTALTVNAAGQVVVANSSQLDYDAGLHNIELEVVATDTAGNVSEPAVITVKVTNLADEESEKPKPVVETKKSSSGSLFWLLLAAPLALFRRKK
ncbi:S8 family serine peptidase [Pseudoalteromonas fenneropenaei]|uniref:S8 family serine peptidase n=1 Tax=Pseudoalteromonas fenneropenaei TaxID=1737459 RepID=A0ABV7CHC0_9GAMM